MKVIDLLNKIANGEEVPKKIKFDEHIYKYVNRVDELYNYKREDGKYLEEVWMLTNILNSEVEIIEEPRNIEVCGSLFTKSEYDELAKSNEDKKIEYLYLDDLNKLIKTDYNEYIIRHTIHKVLLETRGKLNEIIDRLNGEDNE